MTDTLRDRIAAVICDMDALHAKQWSLDAADAVIAALPEFKRLSQIRQICVSSIQLDRGKPTDRVWLADSVFNILNGNVDD